MNRVLSAILRGKWAIDLDYAMKAGPLIQGILNGVQHEEDHTEPVFSLSVDGSKKGVTKQGIDDAPKGSVAVINIKGTLMKDDQECGPAGMATLGGYVQQADASPDIDAIILKIDSPGGTVDGTEVFANIIAATSKPVVSFVDGLAASAALWIAAAGDEIIASTDTDEVGSVGVLLSFADVQPYYEKQGVKFHTVVADTSPEKVKMWEDLRAGKYEQFRKEILNPLDEKFMGWIRQRRPSVEDKHLTGRTFLTRDVKGILVDDIMSFQQAVERALELAADQKAQATTNQIKYTAMKDFPLLSALLKVEKLEASDDGTYLNEEQLQLIEDSIAAADTLQENADAVQQELDGAISALDAIDERVATAEDIDQKVAQVREIISEKPAGGPTEVTGGDRQPGGNDGADWESIDALEHNQGVD